jgi:hypothetical protein
MSDGSAPRTRPATRTLAWDHVSLEVPSNWELAAYRFPGGGVTRIELEDEYAVRLEAEWTRTRRERHVRRLMRRYEERSGELTKKAHERHVVEGLPTGWSATRYEFNPTDARTRNAGLKVARRGLVTALYVHPDRRLVAFLLVHFLPGDAEDPDDLARLLARRFAYLGETPLVRWQVYDLSFDLPTDFALEGTLFDIGAKLLIFTWRLRRFYLWQFSCADVFIKEGTSLERWFAGYLNSFPHVKGFRFSPAEGGGISWKRRFPALIAHREELARWCFRHEVRCHHDRERNRVIAWLFSHRRPEDLEVIPPALRL